MRSLYDDFYDKLEELEIYDNDDQISDLAKQLIKIVQDWLESGNPII